MESAIKSIIYFNDFSLDSSRRILEKNGEIVSLNPKTLDLLLALIENCGEVVGKNELLDRVWVDQFVEENNLTVHVAALRKALGEKKGEHRYIVTVPGRGYSFVAEIRRERIKTNLSVIDSASTENLLFEKQFEVSNEFHLSEPLIGRTNEIAEIKNLLRDGDCRILTLTGAGGSGKTAIARAIAGELSKEFADGVFFVELAAINNYELVVPAIINTLGLKEAGEKPLVEILSNYLRDRRILLILDNFEQVISAAPVLQKLINSTVFLKIIVTSRAALRLKNEFEMVVAPLALPPPEAVSKNENLTNYASVALFLRKAQSSKRNFSLTEDNASFISEICRKLDGLPLAIELAAARIKLLSPQAILKRLEKSLNLLTGGSNEFPPRQQTMRGAIQWSYDLLNDDEKSAFRHLSVFAGGFTVEAAESVINVQRLAERKNLDTNTSSRSKSLQMPVVQRPSTAVLDLLTSLIDNNLLTVNEEQNDEVRLQMLEVVREFAGEYLETHGETDVIQENHAQYFLSIVEEAEPHLQGENSVEWLEKLETEHDNIRGALDWSLKNDTETAGRMAAALRYFWLNHTHLTEGRSWLEKILESYGKNYSNLCFKLLHGIGQFARSQGDFESARKIYEESFAMTKETDNREQMIVALHGRAALAARTGDFATARKLTEEQLSISRELKDESKTAYSLSSLGDLVLAGRDPSAARPLIEESLAISKRIGNKQLESINLVNLGDVSYSEKNYDSAVSHFAESMSIACELGNKSLVSCCLDGFAAVLFSQGNLEQAARLAGAADDLRESINYEIEITESLFRNAYVEKLCASLGKESFESAYLEGRNLDLNEALSLVKFQISATDELSAEIIVETHKFESYVIEGEIEDE